MQKLKSIAILVLISNIPPAWAVQPDLPALRAAAQAFYQYEHWDTDVNGKLNDYEKMFSKEQKMYAGYAVWIANTLIKKQVGFVVHFP